MKRELTELKNNVATLFNAKRKYKKLQRHLNTFPVGFPSTLGGIELRILRDIFTPEEADAALNFDYRLETFDQIYNRASEKGFSPDEFRDMVSRLDSKGALSIKEADNETKYALHPFLIGIFEMQTMRLNPSLYLNLYEYYLKKFAIEYLTTEIPQLRVIPVQESIQVVHNITTYDHMFEQIERTKDKISLIECICRKGKDLVGESCQATDRRNICLHLREYHDHSMRYNRGRAISKEEAFEILAESEKEGLVLMPDSTQEIQQLCSCCSCCCGLLGMMKTLPRPVDFVASNFYAVLDPKLCVGCGQCQSRCHMVAVKNQEKKAIEINRKKCIGCGLCVSTCKSGALRLKEKEKVFIPPKDFQELHEIFVNNKKKGAQKVWTMAKAYMGFKVGKLE